MRLIGLCRAATVLVVTLACGSTDAVAGQEIRQRDLVRVRQLEPWLRINVGGHTGAVYGLAFPPDSQRLCSAGLDKVVHVWNLKAIPRDLRRTFSRERTIRWQVARGLRGSVYAIASAPTDGLLAIGGYGAMDTLGEILLVDPVQGALKEVLEEHRQTVCSLAFSADGKWLASMDTVGHAILWKRGQWKPVTLVEPDEKTYGRESAEAIERQPKLRPIVMIAGSSHAVVPQLAGKPTGARLTWKLRQISISDPEDSRTLDAVHYGVVTAMASSPDGSRLASADLAGNLFLWDLTDGVPGDDYQPVALKPGAIVISLCFSPDGRTLVAGTAVGGPGSRSQLQVWDVENRTFQQRRSLPDHVRACTVSPDGKQLAYVGGKDHEVFLEPLEGGGRVVPLRGTGRRILKVAFAKQKPPYRVAFGTDFHNKGFNDYAPLQETFDPVRLELDTGRTLDPADWISADWSRGDWTAKLRADRALQLFRNGEPKGHVALDPMLGGTPRCFCWIPDSQGKPFAIAVGTDVQNGIYVCRLVEDGPCPVLRYFRGHHDYVTSVGVSSDLRYLVSGSADGTVRFWSLAAYEKGEQAFGRWGVDFAVVGGELQVTTIHEAGPLFRKGIRKGDVIEEIRWGKGGIDRSEKDPAAILRTLRRPPRATQLEFVYSRDGVARPGFQLFPAWQPVATLFTSTDREWAFWTQEGYYDASVNGHTLFGWQVNRGVDSPPDFYRADQFRKRLERPRVMEQLLPAGSLPEAFRRAALQPPQKPEETVSQQIAATPRVKILSPLSGALISNNLAKVTAKIEVPAVSKLVRARVYANGVVATKQELVKQRDVEQGTELTYTWEVPLPRDQRNLIQLVVGTDTQTTAFNQIVVEHAEPAPPGRPARLYILALGINEYGDPEIPPLAYSVADARAVADFLEAGSKGLYALREATLLVNEKVTPAIWRESLDALKEELTGTAAPDDLLILFLAGHGIRDDQTQQYYYLSYDFKYADLQRGTYSGCLSWSDFQLLADIPCRKLAILDTCHSGAIQPMRSANLKMAIRALQEDIVFTVSASAGHEKAAEDKNLGHGVFTKCLLEALAGKADRSGDGVVALDEVVTYVQECVPKLTGQRQNPTAGPREILGYISLPLTKTRPGAREVQEAHRAELQQGR